MIIRNIAEAKKKIKIGSKVTIMTQREAQRTLCTQLRPGYREKQRLSAYMSILSMYSLRVECAKAYCGRI